MTTEERAVFVAALRVALGPPVKPHKYARDALVSWSAIEGLRKALKDAGIDWEAVRRQMVIDRGAV